MDINKTMEAAFNKQIEAELWSANIYLGMAFWFKKEGWNGFASWLFKQADEERGHALDMADYLIARGGVPTMSAIPAVKNDWTDAKEVFILQRKTGAFRTQNKQKYYNETKKINRRSRQKLNFQTPNVSSLNTFCNFALAG